MTSKNMQLRKNELIFFRPWQIFPCSQLYVACKMKDGGCNLSDIELDDEELVKVLSMTAATLAKAKKLISLSHRDTHSGNVLVAKNEATQEIRISLIDYGLSSTKYSYGNYNKCCFIFLIY
jgi:hypothetical protein